MPAAPAAHDGFGHPVMPAAFRCLWVTFAVLIAVGLTADVIAWPLLTATLGRTAYVFAAHPHTEAARLRNAVTGHTVAVLMGLASLGVFGLWDRPPAGPHGPGISQVLASAAAVAVTVALLELLKAHHAPSAATALLVSSGLARPGRPLEGLIVGLAIVVVLGPLSGKLSVMGAGPDRGRAEPEG